jgi:hypothetical protein
MGMRVLRQAEHPARPSRARDREPVETVVSWDQTWEMRA